MCHVKEHSAAESTIVRNTGSKWYVPPHVFPNQTHFPTFCSGYTVLFTSDLIPDLYRHSFDFPLFSVDDVYLFGLLTEQIKGVEFMDIHDHMTLNQKTGLEDYEKNDTPTHVAVNAWENGMIEKLWRLALSKLTPWAQAHSQVVTLHNKGSV